MCKKDTIPTTTMFQFGQGMPVWLLQAVLPTLENLRRAPAVGRDAGENRRIADRILTKRRSNQRPDKARLRRPFSFPSTLPVSKNRQ